MTTDPAEATLQDLREWAGLARIRVAQQIGDRTGHRYSTIECGDRDPTDDEVNRIARVIGITPQHAHAAIARRAANGRLGRPRPIERLEDRDWLAARRQAGTTLAALAAELGCTVDQLRHALKRHGLTRPRPRTIPQLHDPSWVTAQVAAGRTLDEIAAELGCGRSAVSRAIHRYVGRRHPRLHDPEWLAQQAEAGHSLRSIAAMIGCDHKSVAAALDRHHIPRPHPVPHTR